MYLVKITLILLEGLKQHYMVIWWQSCVDGW